jgi:Fur family transcriptional regulator, ferric uptake regulator
VNRVLSVIIIIIGLKNMVEERKIRRNSKQRQVILEELRKQKSHPTAASLYRIVRRRLPKISLGTIYRNLDILTSEGVIKRLYTNGNEARYDGSVDKYYHIRCSQCGRIDDLYDFSLDKANVKRKKIKGYKITGHYFEFVGICPDCQKKIGNKITTNKMKKRR